MEFNNIVPGMTYEREYIVEESDTASHFGNDKAVSYTHLTLPTNSRV